jgi:aminobenzoyl-glutamate utilization protein B
MTMKAQAASRHIDAKRSLITGLADQMWDWAELPLHEHKSAAALAGAMREEGFQVETGVGGMPSAFVATWGSGKPVIGILAEYDALDGLSQEVATERRERAPGAAGHGCQHNLLGAGALGGAIGLKAELEARGVDGTIKLFGCPAEENLSGKAFMAREGVFDGLDVCFTWHPSSVNRVWTGTSLANNAAYFTFRGRAAHAAGDPYNGRSALDAAQLMNMGVEFLREHMSPKARVHYAITNGGGQPNVVPPVAQVWYLARALRRDELDDLWERIIKCARGAAEMTETTFEIEMLKAIWNLLPNTTLEGVLEEAFRRVGAPAFGDAEKTFAGEIIKTVPDKVREGFFREYKLPETERGKILADSVLDRPAQPEEMMGSTDVADVSWCCPTAQFGTACAAMGTPGHSWQAVAQGGMGIGHEGTITAAKLIAEAALEMALNPELVQKAHGEFAQRSGGRRYQCAMPADLKPAFHVFAPK